MANLPRFGRTWQRFSSLPRPGSAAQPEPLQPPAVTEPELLSSAQPTTQNLQTFEPTPPPKVSSLAPSPIRERSSRLPSPPVKLASPPSSPKYRATTSISPPKPAVLSPTPTYSRYDGERRASAPASPKTFKPTQTSPPLSPAKHKYPAAAAAAAPLSPLTLPRSEAKHAAGPTTRSRSPPEVEQKTILFQKPAKSDHRQSEHSSGKPPQKQPSDIINIRGENVGAVMYISQSSDGTETIKQKQTVGSSHENDERKKSGEDEKASKSSSLPAKSFMNSNFQGVNNSILYNSSFSHRDPGLHLSFSRKPIHGGSVHDSRH